MSLDLIIGPMFSGKTSFLLNLVQKNRILEKKIFTVKPKIDNRYNEKNQLQNHNQETEECVRIADIKDCNRYKEYKEAEIVIIDEAQFFEGLAETIKHQMKIYPEKHFYIAGLNGDSNTEPFGEIHRLLSVCDQIHFLHALCILCKDGTKAIFSKCIDQKTQQIKVGGIESYIPVCRRHYELKK